MHEPLDGAESPAIDAVEDPGGIPWIAWTVIVLAAVALVLGNMWSLRVDDSRAANTDLDPLTVLKFQGKNFVGLHHLSQGKEIDLPISDLRKSIPKEQPRMLAAVAVLENFLRANDDEEVRAGILADIDQDIENSAPAEPKILAAVRSAIGEPAGVTASEWRYLEEELGWFGKLLAASEDGPDQGSAQAIRQSAVSTALMLGVGAIGLVAGGLAGVVFLLIAIRRSSQQQLTLHLVPADPRPARVLLECFAVYLGTMAVIEIAMLMIQQSGRRPLPELIYVVVFLPVLGAVVWGAFFRRHDKRALCRAAGLHRGQGFFKEVGCGLLGYITILPVVAIGIVLTILLTAVTGNLAGGDSGEAVTPISHPIVSEIAKGDWKVLLAVFALASVAAPLFEESLFRGAMHGGLRGRRLNFWIAALISSVIFAAIHPQGLLALPGLTAMGFGFAMLREWRGSLIAPMTAHALHNGGLVLMLWIVLGG